MMKLKAFSVLDVKADMFAPPFFMQTVAHAQRAFTATVNDKESAMSQFPEDFKLCLIGEFDQAQGLMISEPPRSLGFATEYKANAPQSLGADPDLRRVAVAMKGAE